MEREKSLLTFAGNSAVLCKDGEFDYDRIEMDRLTMELQVVHSF